MTPAASAGSMPARENADAHFIQEIGIIRGARGI
jgi:hypothetical protein